MEKISHIVRGTPRVASVDMKNSPAVRPGAPSFGRPMGESPSGPVTDRLTTAARAVELQKNLTDTRQKDLEKARAVESMADSFFMSRIRRPEPETPHISARTESVPPDDVGSSHESMVTAQDDESTIEPPKGYKPRGSYVDVRA